MQDIPARNRAIKRVLSAAFAPHKVTVRGSRGSMCYGRATAHIDFAPLDWDQREELERLAIKLLRKAGIDLGSSYIDDTCTISVPDVRIEFNKPTYRHIRRGRDGKILCYIAAGDVHGTWISAV